MIAIYESIQKRDTEIELSRYRSSAAGMSDSEGQKSYSTELNKILSQD